MMVKSSWGLVTLLIAIPDEICVRKILVKKEKQGANDTKRFDDEIILYFINCQNSKITHQLNSEKLYSFIINFNCLSWPHKKNLNGPVP